MASKHKHLEWEDIQAVALASSQKTARPEKLTIAAGGVIFAHNKVLLDRADTSDLWSFPGGVVRFNQSITETTVNRLAQELNLDVEITDTPPFLFKFQLETEEYLETVVLVHFVAKVISPANIRMGGDIIDYRWEPVSSNFRDCYPNVKTAVDHFMKI